jgi:hypothetical protein
MPKYSLSSWTYCSASSDDRLALRKIGRGSPSVPRSTCRTSSSVGGTGFRFSRGSSEGLFSQVVMRGSEERKRHKAEWLW